MIMSISTALTTIHLLLLILVLVCLSECSKFYYTFFLTLHLGSDKFEAKTYIYDTYSEVTVFGGEGMCTTFLPCGSL